jgi:hypothetical protein
MTSFKPQKLNSLKHGLLAKTVILQPEDQRPFNKLAKRLLLELDPQTSLEQMLAEQVIVSYWRLRRFVKLENDIFIYAGSPKWQLDNDKDFVTLFTDFVSRNPSFDLLSRYNASLSRGFYRALHEYQSLKGQSNKAQTSDKT